MGDKSADLSISAGEKGLKALKALASDAKDIDDLKRMGKHRLADSLANVKRMLDSTDFTLNMMSGMASFANMGDWAEGSPDGTNVISNAIASKPNINNPTAYNTYQAIPAWQRQNAGRNLYQQWGPSSYSNNCNQQYQPQGY